MQAIVLHQTSSAGGSGGGTPAQRGARGAEPARILLYSAVSICERADVSSPALGKVNIDLQNRHIRAIIRVPSLLLRRYRAGATEQLGTRNDVKYE